MQKFRNKETGEMVEGRIDGVFIYIEKSSKNFPEYILITGAKFYEEILA